MGIPKLPSFGGINIEVKPKLSTDDQFDGTAKADLKRDRNIEKNATRPDERSLDPAALKREQDEKNLQAAKNLKIGGEDQRREEIKMVAEQQGKLIRQTLNQQLNDAEKK